MGLVRERGGLEEVRHRRRRNVEVGEFPQDEKFILRVVPGLGQRTENVRNLKSIENRSPIGGRVGPGLSMGSAPVYMREDEAGASPG